MMGMDLIDLDSGSMHQNVQKCQDDNDSWAFGESFDFDFIKDLEPKKNSEGCVCKKCKELYPYAEPNQKDGSMICYSCRKYG
jgi:formylmethanofuran dehydrogenase subunit E